MYPHRIRLRGPWECEILESATLRDPAAPTRARLAMPCRWQDTVFRGLAGRVRCGRYFGYPGRIDAEERVWLTFAGADASADAWLNGRLLGRQEEADRPFEFEVTPLLQRRNLLTIEVRSPSDTGGLWGEVALEIRRSAFLRAVQASVAGAGESPSLHVTGEVVGTCERALELYVLVEGRTISYTTVEASPNGKRFEVRAECPKGTPELAARVDLVDGAVIWYSSEMLAAPSRDR